LGIIPSASGVQFVKRDDHGKLTGLFAAYTNTPTMFGGFRKWFACPGCPTLQTVDPIEDAGGPPAVPRIEVCVPV
jgi:hypothetical protein